MAGDEATRLTRLAQSPVQRHGFGAGRVRAAPKPDGRPPVSEHGNLHVFERANRRAGGSFAQSSRVFVTERVIRRRAGPAARSDSS